MFRRTALSIIVMISYLVSTVGLDIHHDHEHGKTYVVSALMAQSCNMIHPHERCHDTENACCSHHGSCEEDEACCTDDFVSVSITGTGPGSQILQHFQQLTAHTVLSEVCAKSSIIPGIRARDTWGPPPEPLDISVRYCVMRV